MHETPYCLGLSSLGTEVVVDCLPLAGSIPAWLRGTLVRTGPAGFEAGARRRDHWFDGLGMLHRFAFNGADVSYRNRWIESAAYRDATEHGSIRRPEFGTDPCLSIFGRILTFFSPRATDNANVNVGHIGERFVAMTETPLPIEFDLETLATLGCAGLDDGVSGQLTTAHPHRDAVRGGVYNYVTHLARKSSYKFYFLADGEVRRRPLARLPVRQPGYMHSFGMTANHLILTEFPLRVRPLRLRFSGKAFIRNFRWDPASGTRFLLFEKDSGRFVGESRTDAFFAFHHVNAFEDDGELAVDMVTYADASIIDQLYLDHLRHGAQPPPLGRLERFRFTPGGDRVRREPLCGELLELPRTHYGVANSKPYRYVYGVGNRVPGDFLDQVVRVDLESGETTTWYEQGCFPGEPVFVATPEGRSEDDGILLSVVLQVPEGRSFLLVLDAATLGEIGRAFVPHHIPFHFHGQFFGEKA